MSALSDIRPALATLVAAPTPTSLTTVTIPPAVRVLVLGPHPDDFDAIGVTLRRLQRNGNPLHAAVLRTGSGVEDSYCTPPTLVRKAAVREQEQRRSLRFFGLPDTAVTFLDLAEDEASHPLDTPANTALLEAVWTAFRPDLVCLPHGRDSNLGHQRVYAMYRRLAARDNRPLAAWLIRDPKTMALRTHLYTPFDAEEARWKSELLRFHDTQHQRNLRTRGHGFDERILQTNRAIARELGLAAPCAEAFEIELFPPAPTGSGTG